MPKTVLFIGAGRHQRRAIMQAKEMGLRVAAVDADPAAPGLQEADIAKVVDFAGSYEDYLAGAGAELATA